MSDILCLLLPHFLSLWALSTSSAPPPLAASTVVPPPLSAAAPVTRRWATFPILGQKERCELIESIMEVVVELADMGVRLLVEVGRGSSSVRDSRGSSSIST